MLTDSLNHLMMEKNTWANKSFASGWMGILESHYTAMAAMTAAAIACQKARVMNHETETPLNFKMRTLERPETITAATTAAAMTCLKTLSSDSGQLVTL